MLVLKIQKKGMQAASRNKQRRKRRYLQNHREKISSSATLILSIRSLDFWSVHLQDNTMMLFSFNFLCIIFLNYLFIYCFLCVGKIFVCKHKHTCTTNQRTISVSLFSPSNMSSRYQIKVISLVQQKLLPAETFCSPHCNDSNH